MIGFWLLVESHRGGSGTNGASPSSLFLGKILKIPDTYRMSLNIPGCQETASLCTIQFQTANWHYFSRRL